MRSLPGKSIILPFFEDVIGFLLKICLVPFQEVKSLMGSGMQPGVRACVTFWVAGARGVPRQTRVGERCCRCDFHGRDGTGFCCCLGVLRQWEYGDHALQSILAKADVPLQGSDLNSLRLKSRSQLSDNVGLGKSLHPSALLPRKLYTSLLVSALGEIFRAHDSAVTGKRVKNCKMGRMTGRACSSRNIPLEIADEVPLYEGTTAMIPEHQIREEAISANIMMHRENVISVKLHKRV